MMGMLMAKLSRWIFFGVVISLVPIAIGYWNLHFYKKPTTFFAIISNGELLLVVVSMCAGAVGEIVVVLNNKVYTVVKIIAAGLTTALFASSAAIFGSVAAARLSGSSVNVDLVTDSSILFFFSALVSCAVCIFLSET